MYSIEKYQKNDKTYQIISFNEVLWSKTNVQYFQ
jgi:hypothetical protein